VGTLTEIYDYLRLLYAHIGHAHCPKCGRPVTSQTPHKIAESVYQVAFHLPVIILAAVVEDKKGQHQGVLEEICRAGWPSVRVDGIIYAADEARERSFDKQKAHTIQVVIDRCDLRRYAARLCLIRNACRKLRRKRLNAKKRNWKIFCAEKKSAFLPA